MVAGNGGVPSYPKVHALGHAAIRDLFDGPVVCQEKVDGSQISFLKDGWGDIHIRSKSARIEIDNPEKLFAKAVEQIVGRRDLLREGYTYRGEYLAKPRHNTLAYDRVPLNHIVLFDVNDGLESYLPPAEIMAEAARLGFEAVPLLYLFPEGKTPTLDNLHALLDRTSFLGGALIEGIVLKNYTRFLADGHAMMGKYVSEAFKETHRGEWKKNNPSVLGFIDQIVIDYRTPARWQKAVQHLRERGELTESPKDIGPLMKEVGVDTHAECQDEIREKLWQYAWPKIQRGITGGLAQWYKDELAKAQLAGVE